MTSPSRHYKERSNRTKAGNGCCCIELTSSRSWPRGASYFCRHKSNQKGLQQRGFFALCLLHVPIARPLPCKTSRTTGCNYFTPVRTRPRFCKNLLCPCGRTFPTLFCPFSPEADLLRKTLWKEDVYAFATNTPNTSQPV